MYLQTRFLENYKNISSQVFSFKKDLDELTTRSVFGDTVTQTDKLFISNTGILHDCSDS